MSHRARCHEDGFTLLEVIVAIALFALIMGIVYSGFSTAVRAYDAAERRVDEIERVRVVSAFIRRSVGGAHALAIAVRREWTLQFDGAPQRLRYIADLPGYVGLGGVHEVVLELASNGAQHELVMRRRPLAFNRIGEIEGEYETRVLAERISGFSMRFYGRMDDDEAPDWHEHW
ncbi:MAG: general secretion pathway protein J, partial [Gammaproteobacteria bacterium]